MELMYNSTRNNQEKVTASQAILRGLEILLEVFGIYDK